MTVVLLFSIILAPPLFLVALWISARHKDVPWKTTAEAAVRLLYWLARWLQGLAEGADSGLLAYRDAVVRPVLPHAEQHRERLERDRIEVEERLELIARARGI